VNRIDVKPRAAHRSASRTQSSTSQNGIEATGMSRRESADAQSICQSL